MEIVSDMSVTILQCTSIYIKNDLILNMDGNLTTNYADIQRIDTVEFEASEKVTTNDLYVLLQKQVFQNHQIMSLSFQDFCPAEIGWNIFVPILFS